MKYSRIIRRFVILQVAAVLVLSSAVLTYGRDSSAGKFKLTGQSRFYVVADRESAEVILDDVRLSASKYAAEGLPDNKPLSVVYGNEAGAKTGDIIIRYDDEESDVQTCSVKTEDGRAYVDGGNGRSIMYGLDELLKQIKLNGNNINISINETPYAEERTLMLDCGRKFYSRVWIENLIRKMSWQKYTSLELHFSDAEGMRIESVLYPWLNESDGKYLSQKDIRSIMKVADQYNVEIIPEFDSPGHMGYVVERYAEYVASHPDFSFSYDGSTYSKKNKGFGNISNYYMYNGDKSAYNNSGIDVSNEVAVAFTYSLVEEYADLFAEYGAEGFNIGGDELFGWTGTTVGGRFFGYTELWDAMEHWEKYAQETLRISNGSSADAFISYLNTLAEKLKDKGYRCRVWNDELYRTDDQHVKLNRDIGIVYWTNDYTPVSRLCDDGNTIYNTNTGWCYYVVRGDGKGGDLMDSVRRACNGKNIFYNWNPRNCANPKDDEELIPRKNYGGSYFAVWADNPDYKDAATVWEDIDTRTWANSQKMWDDSLQSKMSYGKFRRQLEVVGQFPGYSGNCMEESRFPVCDDAQEVRVSLWRKLLFAIQSR